MDKESRTAETLEKSGPNVLQYFRVRNSNASTIYISIKCFCFFFKSHMHERL